jgi:hypothetical protein
MGTRVLRVLRESSVAKRLCLLFLLICGLIITQVGSKVAYADRRTDCINDAALVKYSWDEACLSQDSGGGCSTQDWTHYDQCMNSCNSLVQQGILDPEDLTECFGLCSTGLDTDCQTDSYVDQCLNQGLSNYNDFVGFCNTIPD